MGLGLYVTGEATRSGLFARAPSKGKLLDRIAETAPGLIDDPLARRLVECQRGESRLALFLHPAEETVDISFDDSGAVVLSAKTSSAGPGYHALLVDFVERLGDSVGIEWAWRDADGEPADETGYRDDRDFKRLRQSMADWLQALARHVIGETDLDNLAIAMPLGFSVLHDHYAISPMGVWERDWFERVASAEADQAQDVVQSFFPAWHGPEDARYWLGCGLAMCWVDLPWHAPNDETERGKYQLALDCFARAREIDPAIALPDAEIAEINGYLSEPDYSRPPRPEGAGFRRRMMQCQLTGGWTVDLPGYFYEGLENDGSTVVLWFGDRTVRGSSLAFRAEGGDPSDKGEGAASVRREAAGHEGEGRTADFAAVAGQGWACEEAAQDESGEPYWNARGMIGAGDNLCILTVSYIDPDRGWDWALEVMKSVKIPGSREGG